ncbi:MAG TPA: response regulator, partial [Spirochaetia bacterium]|nr:response regulator [Spirochaetia bacterium]
TIRTAGYSFDASGTPEHTEMVPGIYVTLEVSDTGTGIDKETLARIFEPFFTTKEVGRGTGLGLATVYGIIKQSNGFIYCTSQPGTGTTFTVYLPRVSDPVAEKTAAAETRSQPGSESVLVVEDEEAICNFILSILRRNGYDATGARSGAEAMSIFSSRPGAFRLVLADVVMPRMSGVELGRWIAEAGTGAKVLYMTGYSKHALVQADAPGGALEILRKPFTPEQLLNKIREVLDAG